MEMRSKIEGAGAALTQPSSRWSEDATEMRAMAAKAKDLHNKIIFEHIARLYEALARRLG